MQYISMVKEDLELGSESHRYFRLPHPRTGSPQLYLPYTSNGRQVILEVDKVQCSHRRTLFMGDSYIDVGTILVHHPVDPLFLVIPILESLVRNTTRPEDAPFQPLSDLIESASSSPAFALPEPFSGHDAPGSSGSGEAANPDVARLLALKSVRRVFRLCCERKELPHTTSSPMQTAGTSTCTMGHAGKQVYYRPSMARAIALLQTKVDFFAAQERFEQFDHLIRGLSRDGLLEAGTSTELCEAARRKSTCEHLAQWLSPSIQQRLLQTYDLAPLAEYLANRTAVALAAQAPIVSVKKEDKGAKRKAVGGSRGVEALKKVNTASMSKLTNFFRPKDGKK